MFSPNEWNYFMNVQNYEYIYIELHTKSISIMLSQKSSLSLRLKLAQWWGKWRTSTKVVQKRKRRRCEEDEKNIAGITISEGTWPQLFSTRQYFLFLTFLKFSLRHLEKIKFSHFKQLCRHFWNRSLYIFYINIYKSLLYNSRIYARISLMQNNVYIYFSKFLQFFFSPFTNCVNFITLWKKFNWYTENIFFSVQKAEFFYNWKTL